MTTTQVGYQEHLETKRHNLEMEKLTGQKQAEDRRSHLANERITQQHNFGDETIRSRANDINWFNAVQNSEHFKNQDLENARHNLASELETSTHNRASETADYAKASAALGQAAAAQSQAATARDKLDIDWFNAKNNYTNAQANAQNAESRRSEVSNSNLLRDSQRLANVVQTPQQVEKLRSEVDLNRSRKTAQDLENRQNNLDYYYTPVDKIVNLQNEIGKGVGYALGRRNNEISKQQQQKTTNQGKEQSEQEALQQAIDKAFGISPRPW